MTVSVRRADVPLPVEAGDTISLYLRPADMRSSPTLLALAGGIAALHSWIDQIIDRQLVRVCLKPADADMRRLAISTIPASAGSQDGDLAAAITEALAEATEAGGPVVLTIECDDEI